VRGFVEQCLIEQARQTAAARRSGDDDPIDIDKARVPLAKPQEIRTVTVGALIESAIEIRTVSAFFIDATIVAIGTKKYAGRSGWSGCLPAYCKTLCVA